MSDIKRYVLTVDKYIYAENDKQAIQVANQFAADQRKQFDDRTEVLEILEQPFGTIGNRIVYKRGGKS